MTMITEAQLKVYADYIEKDYAKGYPDGVIPENMVNLRQVVSWKRGSKFIKVITGYPDGHGRSVHSFIAANEKSGWPVGTILKPASWSAPAQNFSRGNIVEVDFSRVRWTGAQ